MSKHIQIAENPAMQFLSLGQGANPKVQAEPVPTPLAVAKVEAKREISKETSPEACQLELEESGMPVDNSETPLKAVIKEVGAKIQQSSPVKNPRELKRRRVNLIIRQSLSDDLEMTARMKEISFNGAFSRAVKAYIEAERENLESYKRFRAKIQSRDEDRGRVIK
jgi:hypothetical protein